MKNNKFLLALLGILVFAFPTNLALDDISPPPFMESTKLELLYSRGGKVVVKIVTPKQVQYKNGDALCPDGIYAECYDEHKKVVTELRANTFYKYADSQQCELKGDVEIKTFQEGKCIQLNTEEAYWNLDDENIYTDKFIRIETDTELLLGYGLQAKQDLSFYSIQMPQGFVEDELGDLAK